MFSKEKIDLINRTVEEAKYFIDKGEDFAIVNATGTGKSIVLGEIIDKFYKDKKILFLSPQENIAKIFEGFRGDEDIEYVEYFNIGRFIEEKPEDYFKNIDLIIADELHRSGAKTWSKNFKKLSDLCCNAIKIGATATPKRTDQRLSDIDMVDVFFSSNRVGNCNLVEALEKGILPTPTYIAVMHNIIEEVYKRKNIIKKIRNEKEREDSEKSLNNILIDWENRDSLFKILNTHLSHLNENKGIKILVFAKNISHLKEIKKELDVLFARVFPDKKYNFLEYHSKTDDKDFEFFKEADSDLNIMYSVDKFNEGIHINDLDCIIMLRNTQSEIIYFQQIGRVLSIGGSENPIIIDLVNNFNNVKNFEIFRNLDDSKSEKSKKDKKFQVPRFYDYTIDAMNVFKDIDSRINNSLELYKLKDGFEGSIYQISKKYKISYIEILKGKELNLDMDTIVESLVYLNNLNYFGKKKTLTQISKEFKIPKGLLIHRMNKGMSIEEAVEVTLKIRRENGSEEGE